MKLITSRDNPTLKQLRALAEDPREVRKQGRTLLDGPHLVETYQQRVGLPEFLLVSESGAKQEEVQSIIARHQGLTPLCLSDALFREVSPTRTPVGVMAVISVPPQPTGEKGEGDYLLLDSVQDAGNVGTLLRSAAAFGIRNVFLGSGCAGAWSPKVMRAAQGAHFGLSIHEQSDLATVLDEFHGLRLATVVSQGTNLYEQDLSGAIAWVFGSEGQGVSSSLLAGCDNGITIPMTNACESLNVAVAAGICMAESARQKYIGGMQK